jgi:acyl-CoA dehydrogenase
MGAGGDGMLIEMTDGMKAVAEICQTITRKIDRAYVAECGRRKQRPDRLWQMWADTGLMAIGLPEEYGGVGGQFSEVLLASDLLHQAGLVMPAITTQFMARAAILKHGSEDLRQRFLRPSATGEVLISAGITEPDSGSNLFKLKSSVKRLPNGDFVLNGTKTFQTGFVEAQYAQVVARSENHGEYDSRAKGLTMLMVDTKSPGISTTLLDIQMHLPDHHYTVSFDDVVVPKENLLGEEGQAIRVLFDWLNPERLIGAANAVGQADYVLNKTAEHARLRAPFRAPIGAYQAIQHPMAVAKSLTEAGRLMMYDCARRFDLGEDVELQSGMVKWLTSDAFSKATNIAMDTFGGYSMDLSTDLLPFYLLSKLQEIAPVANNIVLNQIAEKAFGLPKSY